jgi:hypothetical protein
MPVSLMFKYLECLTLIKCSVNLVVVLPLQQLNPVVVLPLQHQLNLVGRTLLLLQLVLFLPLLRLRLQFLQILLRSRKTLA